MPPPAQRCPPSLSLDAMRVLSIVHQSDAGAGVFADVVRGAGAELVEWVPSTGDPPELDGIGAALVFGGAMHADQENDNPWLRGEKGLLSELLGRGVPTLGVCLGAQLVSEAAGGSPRRAPEPEIGWVEVELTPEGRADPLLGALPERFEAFEWHSYEAGPPEGTVTLATQRRLHPGLSPPRRARVGDPVPRRGHPPRRGRLARLLRQRRGRGAHRARPRGAEKPDDAAPGGLERARPGPCRALHGGGRARPGHSGVT